MFPGHGVVRVTSIVAKAVGGNIKDFYVLSGGQMTYVLPTDTTELRSIVSSDEAWEVVDSLERPRVKNIDSRIWSTRYRQSMEQIKTGNIKAIALVLIELQSLDKDLSFGERILVDYCKQLLKDELYMHQEIYLYISEKGLL